MTLSDPPPTSGFLRAAAVLTLAPGVSGDSVWWQEGRIRAVGNAVDLARRVPTRVPRYECPGTLVTPGFVDGHTHFGMWARGQRRVHLAGAGSRAEALRLVANGIPEHGWILGHGWDANRWEASPDRASLDQVTSVPAYLESIDIHAAWVNTAALLAAGINQETPDPEGGRIVRDGTGAPTGLLLERATQLVGGLVPATPSADLVAMLRDCQRQAHRLGITGIHNVEGPEVLRAFRALETKDALRLRVLFSPPVSQLPALLAHQVRSGEGGDWLALGGVKLFLDGSLGSRTAWMLDPYEGGSDRGMPLAGDDEARAAVRLAAEGGLACVVHAIGDAAVRRALDLLEPVPRAPLPHRIEHFQCVHPDDLTRASRAGIVASMQPGHLPGDVGLAEERWGRRGEGAYAFRSLLSRGTVLAFGSDVPVVSLDPRLGVVAAMERVAADGSFAAGWQPGERLLFEEVVRGFTEGNAIAGGVADRRGRLLPGYDADLVAWTVDPRVLHGAADGFRDSQVALTVVGGEAVYARE